MKYSTKQEPLPTAITPVTSGLFFPSERSTLAVMGHTSVYAEEDGRVVCLAGPARDESSEKLADAIVVMLNHRDEIVEALEKVIDHRAEDCEHFERVDSEHLHEEDKEELARHKETIRILTLVVDAFNKT